MAKFWFTFGYGQGHDNCYTVIEAEDSGKARAEMIRNWGTKWAFQYDSAEAAGVDRWHLEEIK